MGFLDILKNLLSAKVLTSVALAVLTVVAYFLIRRFSKRRLKQSDAVGARAVANRLIYTAVRLAVLIVGILLILQVNEVKISGLVAGVGIVSAVIGLALQDYIKDVIMGIHILNDHFYSEGDCLEYNGVECEVVALSLKTTKLRSMVDDSVITLCNSTISQAHRIGNILNIDMPLSYEEDRAKIDCALSAACHEILKMNNVTDCQYRGLQTYESSAIVYRIVVYCAPVDRPVVRRNTLQLLYGVLQEADISIPYDQLQVHLGQ